MSFSVVDSLKNALVKPHPAGHPFIAGGIIATAVFMLFSGELAWVALIYTLFCLYFFRDPVRVTPQKDSLVVAGGDGLISGIVPNVTLPTEIAADDDRRYTRVSTFLSVLDVHVNRNAVSGRVMRKVYVPGKFFNAELDKASEDNERCSLIVETPSGQTVGVVQIAGLIARRILNDVEEGETVVAGARFGIIRFGSRVDIYLPDGINPLVCVGQRVIGGETIIADFENREPARIGAVV
ncbi:MAG: Phosphatidylserine decarboxylase [Micavibrio sp.]|nr:Phosphatidylserine decarboxylase [Micavibrio sp.]